ncbi:hypothetical protein Bca52824_075284 [Brassica carinata]|uniref:Uncharacterized protein n=1 Tax=Brassica carinata TaxID=52824 RepID=A0A8X7TV98_BRACI|nr:hypothetical protein Bca52824_075284 [Brassica carinata]
MGPSLRILNRSRRTASPDGGIVQTGGCGAPRSPYADDRRLERPRRRRGMMLALSHDYIFMRKDRGVLYMSEVDIGLSMPDYFAAMVRSKIGTSAARREVLLSGKKIRGEAVALGIVDSAAHDSAEGVVEATVSLAEKLAAKKWNGDVYASIRKSLYPELCEILGLKATIFATPKL